MLRACEGWYLVTPANAGGATGHTMEVDALGRGRCVVLHSIGGHQIIECGYNQTAQEIARCWNAHEALLAACEVVELACATGCWADAISAARSALALARGGA